MRFVSIYIKEGMLERAIDFSDRVNLIHSERNSCGKTTLLRFMLYGLGYQIPNTRRIKFDKCEVKTIVETDNHGRVILERNNTTSVHVTANGNTSTFVLPEHQCELHQILYGTDNKDLLNNILGSIYVDQEKGWTLLNRGVVIGSIHFNIEELIRGLTGIDCSDLISKEARLSRDIEKYKQMQSFAQYQDSIEKDSLVDKTYEEEKNDELDRLLIKKKELQSELRRIDHTFEDNKRFKKFVAEMKLLIMTPSGETVAVTEDNIIGLSDAVNLLVTKRKYTSEKLSDLMKKIEKLSKERDAEYEQLALFASISPTEKFDREISKLSLNQSFINQEIKRMEKERKGIREQITKVTNSNNSFTIDISDHIISYLEELQLGDKDSIPATYLFTSNLKELSGAVLHKTAFAFRLAYIAAIEKKLNIKLPIILDSPSGKEVDQENIKLMMEILKRDFGDHQIIIASILEYEFDAVNKIVLCEKLISDLIKALE